MQVKKEHILHAALPFILLIITGLIGADLDEYFTLRGDKLRTLNKDLRETVESVPLGKKTDIINAFEEAYGHGDIDATITLLARYNPTNEIIDSVIRSVKTRKLIKDPHLITRQNVILLLLENRQEREKITNLYNFILGKPIGTSARL